LSIIVVTDRFYMLITYLFVFLKIKINSFKFTANLDFLIDNYGNLCYRIYWLFLGQEYATPAF